MKILVIIDGLGDKPCKVLGNNTPLAAAHTPYLDALTRKGRCGYVYTVSEKIAPESDIAVTALLGYNPYKYYTGRGPLEAYGAGMHLKKGWLALRTNFSTVNETMRLVDRRAGRTLTTRDAHKLAKAINKKVYLDVPFEFRATIGHRGILVIKDKLSDQISNADPAYEKEGSFGVAVRTRESKVHRCEPLDHTPKAQRTARIINDFVHQSYNVLRVHRVNTRRERKGLFPANIIIPRDAGTSLPKFPQKQAWAAVVSMPLEIGLAKLAGMHILPFTYPAMRTTNVYNHLYKGLKKTIHASITAIKQDLYSHYYIHFKEVDVAGHDNQPFEKKKMLELIDRRFFRFLTTLSNIEVIITGDHSTPCQAKGHTKDPVPLLYLGKGKPDAIKKFSERTSKKGSLGKLYGKDVLRRFKF